MIRVRVELVPWGIESRAQQIGCLEICNAGTGTRDRGNYYFTAKEQRRVGDGNVPPFYPNETREEVVTRGEVDQFPRLTDGVFDLIREALNSQAVAGGRARDGARKASARTPRRKA